MYSKHMHGHGSIGSQPLVVRRSLTSDYVWVHNPIHSIQVPILWLEVYKHDVMCNEHDVMCNEHDVSLCDVHV